MCKGPHPFIPAIDTAQVRMQYAIEGQQVENVFYFQAEAPFNLTTLEALATSVHTGWTDFFAPNQPTALTLTNIVCTALDESDGAQYTLPVNEAGHGIQAALPLNASWALKFSSGFRGRSRRGRMYWLQMTEPNVTGSMVNADAANAILTGVQQFFDHVNTDTGARHVIVSYCGGGVWRTDAEITEVESISYTDLVIDSQRNRLPGRGR